MSRWARGRRASRSLSLGQASVAYGMRDAGASVCALAGRVGRNPSVTASSRVLLVGPALVWRLASFALVALDRDLGYVYIRGRAGRRHGQDL